MGHVWEWGWRTWAFLGLVLAASLWWDKRRRERGQMRQGVVLVRARPPGSHYFKNIVVLAVVVALGWFFWYVMGTRCNGAC